MLNNQQLLSNFLKPIRYLILSKISPALGRAGIYDWLMQLGSMNVQGADR